VLWIARTGSPWRDLPPLFGKWNTVFKRYSDWVKADVFKRIFDAVSEDPVWNTPWSTRPSSKFTE
jgi:transposase